MVRMDLLPPVNAMVTSAIALVILHLLQRWKNWWLTAMSWVIWMVLYRVMERVW